jgi:hypothetical protein
MPCIFDNIAVGLLPALRDTLEISQRKDFCVGCFNLHGWKTIEGLKTGTAAVQPYANSGDSVPRIQKV